MPKKMERVQIDGQKLSGLLKDKNVSKATASYAIGCSNAYLSNVISTGGAIPKRKLELLCDIYKFDWKDVLPEPEEKPDSGMERRPYSMLLDVKPDRVHLKIFHLDQKIYEARSFIKGNTELDLMQAISYAAHMCYKLAEQKKLEG